MRNLSLWRRWFVLSQYFETCLLELELCVFWAKPPEMGIQAVESGRCCPRLCGWSPFWICSGLLRASFSSVLSYCREVTLSAILCFILQVLFCVFMDVIYIHPLCKMICAECLTLRGYVVGCLQAVGVAHLFFRDWIFPILNFKANIPYHTREKMCQLSFRFSHLQLFIFALSTSILFMLQVMSVLGSHIRLLICLNWDLKTSCSLAALSAQGLE